MPITTILFDFMGTCLDWHSAITSALPSTLPSEMKSSFALTWRHSYFDACIERLQQGLPYEDIDLTHRRTLNGLLKQAQWAAVRAALNEEDGEMMGGLIQAWHNQPAWPEVRSALLELKAQGYEVFVHANGTTRLQLDLCRFSGLAEFDLLFSSEMLGAVYKPAAESYERVLKLLRRKPSECVTVAAHVSDLRGAKAVGMRTVYVRRWTDDVSGDYCRTVAFL